MIKLKAVGYCRVSTDNQKDEGTIGLQVDAVKEFAKADYDLIDTFTDEGVSGGLEDRPALAKLLDYIENPDNEIKAVIIYKLDRLARDLIIQENLIKDFEKRGVKLISTKETDLDSKEPTRVFIRQVLGGVSQYEKGLITMRLSGGRNRKARNGGYAGGRVALGYSSIDKELQTTIGEADTIKTIFAMKRKKLSLNEIARRLNAGGFKTKTGTGKWYAGTISYILKNKLYKGNYSYNDIKTNKLNLALVV